MAAHLPRLLLVAAAALLCACGIGRPTRAPEPIAAPGAPAQTGAASAATPAPDNVPASDRVWARQALHVLDTVDQAVKDYHASTELPYSSARALQLRQSAYAALKQAVAEHQAMLTTTQQVKDASDRDQYMFVLGNVGGFLTPTPDLAGDKPSAGDRIARSLENAIAGGAALRPRLERLAVQR